MNYFELFRVNYLLNCFCFGPHLLLALIDTRVHGGITENKGFIFVFEGVSNEFWFSGSPSRTNVHVDRDNCIHRVRLSLLKIKFLIYYQVYICLNGSPVGNSQSSIMVCSNKIFSTLMTSWTSPMKR